ncbi:hypothetical protein NQ176_g10263 [Zarea fungicola]|uniref:Uncharacterized protein n=1 Tax=Zarea fungicola TaxID=93591 RepID=A0ACC1MHS9_9HYPO|nr:hypothetical protein NQ176_g10263 [Lecanicillium fungicola]
MNAGTSSQELVFQNGHVNEGRLSLMGAHATTADLGSPMSGITVDLTEENDEEPPTKRLRLSTSARNRANSQSRREILKARLRSQILPHIIRAVYELPAGELKHDAIAVQAASILARDPEFQSQLNENNVPLTPDETAAKARRAASVVQALSLLPEYRIENKQDQVPLVIKEEKLASVVIEAVPAFPSAPPQLAPPSAPKETGTRLRKPYKPRVKKESLTQPVRQWMQLKSRPYLSAADREAVQNGSRLLRAKAATLGDGPVIFHVDFSAAEVAQIINHVAPFLPVEPPRTTHALKQLCDLPISTLVEGKLSGRTEQDVRNFCSDLLADKAADLQDAKILSLGRKDTALDQAHHRAARVSSLLFARELAGSTAGMGHMRHYVNLQASFKQSHEDAMRLTAEFTNCAGDISTMTWVPDQNILCGTTAHSDAHNQQYNKPGNLLLCSTSLGVLRAFPDHRIPRPIVSKGENSSAAMRRSQDPWIYSSVVSSDYDAMNGFAYTSSFDKTIKAWKIDKNGGSMEAVATFQLDGNVNFVVAAKDGSGRVAAAADATSEAIRIYTMDPDNMAQSSYYTISCTRNDAHGSDKWAYFPATLQQ